MLQSTSKIRATSRTNRRKRIQARIRGTKECPRISLFRSKKHLVLQLIDDVSAKTVLSASDAQLKEKDFKKEKNPGIAKAFTVGKMLAEKAKASGISRAVFDRGGYLYHGRVKAAADGAREGGLEF